jgi:hypothetical protein
VGICKGVFEILYLGWRPGPHPDIVMGRMCDSGGVSKVSYGVQALVFAGKGVELGHEGGDRADHLGAYCSNWRMIAAAEHVILCVIVTTEWTG